MDRYRLALALVVGFSLVGCTSTKSSSTARTGVEQLLISNSVDQALDKVDFQAFSGQKVLVEEKYIDCVDKPYVIGSVRHRIARAGGRLVAKPEEADVVVEVRSGGVGTDTSDAFVGIPEIALPGMVTLPEVRLVQRLHQSGTAKIALVAYDAKTMQLLGEGGVSLAQSNDNNWFVFGVGPYQNGSIKSEIRKSTLRGPFTPTELPTNVAFYPPADSAAENGVQFTSGPGSEPGQIEQP
ncbi:MAG: DUF6655 family protein [Planctomycetaceae bacterium]